MRRCKKKQQIAVRIICWCVIPVIVVLILVFDFLEIYQFTAERYALIIILIVSLLIPVSGDIVAELKIGEISFKSRK